jgi:hypothetical protein
VELIVLCAALVVLAMNRSRNIRMDDILTQGEKLLRVAREIQEKQNEITRKQEQLAERLDQAVPCFFRDRSDEEPGI